LEPDGSTGSETLEDDDMLLDDEFSVLLEDISELDVLVVVVVGAVVVVVLVSELVCGSLAGGSLSVGADEIGSSVEAGGEYSTDSELSVLLSDEMLSGGVSAVLCMEFDEEGVADIVEDVDDGSSGTFGTVAVKRDELLDEDTLPISIMFTVLSPELCVSVEQPARTQIDIASDAATINLLLISLFPKFSV